MNNQKIKLLEEISPKLYQRLASCDICPRNCKVNRLTGQAGYCQASEKALVYSAFLHQGEEPGISAKDGSGTIFFSGCNLRCVYCQNYKFSQNPEGAQLSPEALAETILDLAGRGAANINFVTPTHFIPQILKSLLMAYKQGLDIPIVYNSSGYEKNAILGQIKGIVDVYLVDLRYIDERIAKEYSLAPNYPQNALESIIEMVRQQPEVLWHRDALVKGVVIRHLILPSHIQHSKKVLKWIKDNAPQALVSVMFQYQPYYKAYQYPQVNRKINTKEYKEIKSYVKEQNIKGWIQDFTPQEDLAGPYIKPGLEK